MNTAADNIQVRLKNGGEKCTLPDRNVKLYRTRPLYLPVPAVTPRQAETLWQELRRPLEAGS